MEILLILEEVIFRSRLADVDKVIGNMITIDYIITKILTCADSHAAIYLPRIAAQDFGLLSIKMEAIGQCSREPCLSAGRRTEYGDHLLHIF